ncbi:hypothetical protein [Tepidimonas charontis]|uniref:VCBS repeat-containing protein n=1 Tax=Tepidimonas charontis TaxID=2267262 RepID=A0A554XHF8_9BURK|nr:hypothetical protein [Tepidimonas charontis]TSE35262.1 hypothetical protein Tchar_00873 [Tepidimonas charontis]
MHITDSHLVWHAHAQAQRHTTVQERLQAWSGSGAGAEPRVQRPATPQPLPMAHGPKGTSRQDQRAAIAAAPMRGQPAATHGETLATNRRDRTTDGTAATRNAGDDPTLDPSLRTLARMIEALTGLRVRVFRAEALHTSASLDVAVDAAAAATSPDSVGSVGWGLIYDRVEIHVAEQHLTFQASGHVALADGRQIDFALDFALHSTTVDVRALSVRAGDAVQRLKDPLVLALDAGLPALSDLRFAFDLDADGTLESIPFVATGSGFLALDRNGNGRIDDGRELFGALTGDGFAELSALDDDGNGWIDAADAGFARLLVWTRDGAGTERLQPLGDAGVGALHLGRVATPFALGEAGRLRSSGMYLTEDGNARLMQQIDLVV